MRHCSFLLVAASVSLVAAAIGCSNDDGSDDDGSSSGAATSSSSGGSSGAVSQNDGGSSSSSSSGAANAEGTVTVTVAGESYPVVLADLETTTFKDLTVVTLPTVWKATGLKSEFTAYNFDFVGADGFRPATRPNCKDVVFDGATTFAKGYIEVASRRLTWADDLGFAPCASVSDLATIEATNP